jgi:hypothetical protein
MRNGNAASSKSLPPQTSSLVIADFYHTAAEPPGRRRARDRSAAVQGHRLSPAHCTGTAAGLAARPRAMGPELLCGSLCMKGAMQSRVAKKFPEKFAGPIETELGIDFKRRRPRGKWPGGVVRLPLALPASRLAARRRLAGICGCSRPSSPTGTRQAASRLSDDDGFRQL